MSIIYHYTSLDGFMSIMTQRQLWLTDVKAMNDSLEIEWFNRLLDTKIKHETSAATTPYHVLEILEKFKSCMLRACCFSEDDGDTLSQWRAYGEDGHGVAIGFDREKLVACANQNNRNIVDIIYDQTAQDGAVMSVVNELIHFGSSYEILEEHAQMLKSYGIIESLIETAVSLKNPAFAEEREVRLFTNSTYSNEAFGSVQFRISGRKITSYETQTFRHEDVASVVLGPKFSMSNEEVKYFLNHCQCPHVEIVRSSASYR